MTRLLCTITETGSVRTCATSRPQKFYSFNLVISARRPGQKDFESLILNYFKLDPNTCPIEEFKLLFETVHRWLKQFRTEVQADDVSTEASPYEEVWSAFSSWITAAISRSFDIFEVMPRSMVGAIHYVQHSKRLKPLAITHVKGFQRAVHALWFVYIALRTLRRILTFFYYQAVRR